MHKVEKLKCQKEGSFDKNMESGLRAEQVVAHAQNCLEDSKIESVFFFNLECQEEVEHELEKQFLKWASHVYVLHATSSSTKDKGFSICEKALRTSLMDDVFGLYGLKKWKLLSFRDCDITARDADAILGPNDNEYFEDEYVFDRIHYTEVYKKVSLLKGIYFDR